MLTLFEFLSNSQKFCFLNCFSFGLWTVILYPSPCWVSPGTVSLQHLSWHVSLGSVRRHGACHHHLRESINVAIKCKQGTILDTQRELMIRHESGLLSLSVKQHSANVRVLLQSWSWSRWKRGQRGRLWPPATTWKGNKPTRVTQVASQDSWSVAFTEKKKKERNGTNYPRVDLLLHTAKYGAHTACSSSGFIRWTWPSICVHRLPSPS